LETPLVFNSQEERDQFTEAFFFHDVVADEDFWSVAMDFTLESIEENIPSTRGELKKCRDSYFKDMDFLIKEHFFVRDLDIYQGTAWEGNLKLRNISGRIGYVFCDAIDTLLSPPKGSKIVLISEQLETCLQELDSKAVIDYFSSEVNRHVYYIAGFLCHAGQKEKDRRSTDKRVGKCIGAVSSHFVSESTDVDRLKSELPPGLYKLVDDKTGHGGLKYPNLQFYSLVAKMEYCYSQLATPANLKTYGGIVLKTICTEIASHDKFLIQFASLFDDDTFDELTIRQGFQYYVKVFANLRIQDLCRKYNSQLHKTTTGTFRSTIATKPDSKKSSSKKSKLPRREKEEESGQDKLTDDQLHDTLIEIAEAGVIDEDDEEEEV
jgi:hypothetical protein